MPMSVMHRLDGLLLNLLTYGWPESRRTEYVSFLKVDDEESDVPNVIGHSFEIIDAKATGLLAHVSMMIAALALVSPLVADSRLEQSVILFEIMLYLLAAIGCLRCMVIFDEADLMADKKILRNRARDELIIRRELYQRCNKASMFLTVLIFFSIPLLFFYTPNEKVVAF